MQENRKKNTETIPYPYSILIRNTIHYCYGIRILRRIKMEGYKNRKMDRNREDRIKDKKTNSKKC